MPKLKPIERLERDVHVGDLVRILFGGEKEEFVGRFVGREREVPVCGNGGFVFKGPFNSGSPYLEVGKVANDGRYILTENNLMRRYDGVRRGVVIHTYASAESYEVLRRNRDY